MTITTWFVRLRSTLRLITKSISFYPTMLTISFLILALFLDSELTTGLDKFILDKAPFLTTKDPSTTRTLLGAMIGGLMTLTVFSFTMVMVILNQASSMYSPRLLPGLISNKRHQMVLGLYLGALVYSVVTLVGVRDADDSYTLPSTAIVVAIGLMALCVAFFVYFIHSISTSIQINVIINDLYNKCTMAACKWSSIDESSARDEEEQVAQELAAQESGYVIDWDEDALKKVMSEVRGILRVTVDQGDFLLTGERIAVSTQILTQEQIEAIHLALIVSKNQVDRHPLEESPQYLVEIALRAMSPGINDPMTAVAAIEKLTMVLEKRQLLGNDYINTVNEHATIVFQSKPYKVILRDILIELDHHCASDPMVKSSIIRMIKFLARSRGASWHDISALLKDRLVKLDVNT